tara:strand:+ start:263 stop:385 length:123 start_codon:yes stop_codon:yes gene_type:complete
MALVWRDFFIKDASLSEMHSVTSVAASAGVASDSTDIKDI